MSDTAAQQSTETTSPGVPAPAPKAKGKGGAKAAPKAAAAPKVAAPAPPAVAPPPAADKKPDAPAPHPAEAVVADRRPEDTVAGRKAAEEAAKAADDAAKNPPGAGLPRSKSLEEVKAERRARAAAAPADGAKKDEPAAGDKKPDAPPSPAEAATAAAAAATAAQDAKDKKPAEAGDEEEETDDAEPAAAAAEPAKPKTTEVDIPAEKLTEFTKLNRDLRNATTRIRTLEAEVVPRAEALKKAQELAAAGKHVDAIKAAGFDLDAAVREVLMVDDKGDDKAVDPAIKQLQDELAKTTAKLAKLEGTQSEQEAAAKAAALKAEKDARARGEKQIVAEVTMAADKFPYLSKSPKFVSEALDPLTDSYDAEGRVTAKGAYTLAREALKRDLTDEEKNNLIRSALEEAEAGHAARAKLYGVVPRKPKKPADPAASTATAAAAAKPADEEDPEPTTADGAMRGSVAVVRPRGKRTLAEIKAERRRNSGR